MNFTPTFSDELLDSLDEVTSGTPLDTARRTLSALGFMELPTFEGEVGRHNPTRQSHHTWVHPNGVVVAGSHGGGPLDRLQEVRMSAVVNFGWQAVSQASAFGRGATWMTLDGQVYSQANPLLDERRNTLLTCLSQLEREGRLEPFERWSEETRQGNVFNWLFALGNEKLQLMESSIGVEAWLEKAPTPLKEFIVDRLKFIADTNSTTFGKDPYKWAEKPLLHVRKLAQLRGLPWPTEEEKNQVQQWVLSGFKEPKAVPDFDTQRTGLTQAAILTHQLHERTAQLRLLDWMKTAPPHTLRRVVLHHDIAGFTLGALLLKAMVDTAQGGELNRSARRPGTEGQAVGLVVAQAFECLLERLGADTVARSLDSDGNLMGMVAGFVRASTGATSMPKTRDQLVADTLNLVHVLENGGVSVAPNARLALFQRTPEERETEGDLGPPSQLRGFLESLTPGTDWSPLVSLLSQRHLESSLGEAAKRSRPRF